MRTFRPITVTLPVELADMVKAKVASGEYASESAVIVDSLHALMEKDAATERWLREEAAFAYDAHKADPTRAMPLADTIAKLKTMWHDGKASGTATEVDFDTLKDEVRKELAAAKRNDR